MTGQRFGRYVVIERDHAAGLPAKWICKCDCGEVKSVRGHHLRRGRIVSCGCYAKDQRHGMSHTSIYGTWEKFIRRCYVPVDKAYHNYGGRGISVSDEWRESFENFYRDMGDRPPGMSLDRIDNDGDYCKENCRWASARTQCNNSRQNRRLTIDGRTLTVAQWARVAGINPSTIRSRIQAGWSHADAVFAPVGGRRAAA